jgi:hypothetical protein
MRWTLCLVSLTLAVSTCSCQSPTQRAGGPDVTATADPTTPEGTAAAPGNRGGGVVLGPDSGVGAQICSRLTREDIAALAGSAVREGQVAGPLGSACSWDFETTGGVFVQLVTPDYWTSVENPQDSFYRSLPGIGHKAFVQPNLGGRGWVAAALFADRIVLVDLRGPTSTPELATGVLTGVLDKLDVR